MQAAAWSFLTARSSSGFVKVGMRTCFTALVWLPDCSKRGMLAFQCLPWGTTHKSYDRMRAVREAIKRSVASSLPQLTSSLIAGKLVDRLGKGLDRGWRHISGVESRTQRLGECW